MTEQVAVPQPVMGLYDEPLWKSISERRLQLQCCTDCGHFRYPPGPACPACLSERAEWREVSGYGTILSWVVFHKQYLPFYPPPYNVLAVRLEEGPIMISNLSGVTPTESWIGKRVKIVYETVAKDMVLPRFTLEEDK